MFSLIGFLIFGLVAGAVARLLVPGKDKLSWTGTMALGCAGSFVGGFIGWLVFNRDKIDGAVQTARFSGSVFGAIIVLLLYRKFGKSVGQK
jgi:uncharacterized membrane protein YeaQ/YmgE (transglycosylase-associated protein family)